MSFFNVWLHTRFYTNNETNFFFSLALTTVFGFLFLFNSKYAWKKKRDVHFRLRGQFSSTNLSEESSSPVWIFIHSFSQTRSLLNRNYQIKCCCWECWTFEIRFGRQLSTYAHSPKYFRPSPAQRRRNETRKKRDRERKNQTNVFCKQTESLKSSL